MKTASKFAKVMFLHLSVILFMGGVVSGIHPPRQARPPLGRHTPVKHPWAEDGHCCRRYASYWNAFLFVFNFIYLIFNATMLTSCVLLRVHNFLLWGGESMEKISRIHQLWWLP